VPHKDYSNVPLSTRLGIREGSTVVLSGAPVEAEAWLSPLPQGVRLVAAPDGMDGDVDVALVFATEMAALTTAARQLVPLLTPAGGLWLCSPKKASRVPTDIDFDRVQALGLGAGLVDNKVASINEVYTGVRFVRRVRDRLSRRGPAAGRPARDRDGTVDHAVAG